MAHVELSLSEVFTPAAGASTEPEVDNFGQWSSTVSHADEPCLLIDADTKVVAISAAGCELLCLGKPEELIGLPLLDGGLRLVDFTANRGELTEQETDKIPPLLALSSGRLARGLLRVQVAAEGAPDATVDAISTPVLTNGAVAGSLTFFSGV
ncbi:PAS domain-containing protein [Micromonospora sp. WMMD812]|uniref:PAS domain-containing protein n=1 Tax=Micromonospora sp. WMMD812 TaxID=3015152 RepID=UPI00248C2D62|nr:PAS domain-containing protein [Micromonospora sp. WMMD812]WBB65848.1 PAS domain-containing protein [Micromonospora sp. WMMD812]